MVVPFVGHIFSNLLEGRELSHRESQAVMALERFVRDVRGADIDDDDISDHEIILQIDGNDVTYDIVSGSLHLDGQVLAKYLDDSLSKFDNDLEDTLGYKFITLTLVLQMSGGGTFELSASSFPRMISATGGNQGGGNQGGGNQGGGNQGGGNQGGGNQGGGNQGGGNQGG
jgi:hypothetical protein